MKPVLVTYKNAMACGQYTRTRLAGDMRDHPSFQPRFTPAQMLALGVFEGCYLNSCRDEYPDDWFLAARLAAVPTPAVNHFGVKSRKPLSWWHEKKLIHPHDPRGWFEWYCRFWLGRRMPGEDERQVRRWRQMARHAAQVRQHGQGDPQIRPRQRQTLLQWSYNPFPDLEQPK